MDFDTMMIDPPRRGFPELDNWVKKIKPRFVVYVGCNPASLARDLRGISTRFRFENVQLLDMFPATSRFEDTGGIEDVGKEMTMNTGKIILVILIALAATPNAMARIYLCDGPDGPVYVDQAR